MLNNKLHYKKITMPIIQVATSMLEVDETTHHVATCWPCAS